MPARVTKVDTNSVAARNGIRPGDVLVSMNGIALRDVIDYQLYSEDSRLAVVLERNGETDELEIEKEEQEPLGLRFESSLFDGLKRCRNRCIFCFVDQLPPGARRSLTDKDDDYRLSFLYGNFITLTNMNGGDVARIVEQRLSPLYVSLHTTDPMLHEEMLRPAGDDSALERLGSLLDGGIEIHIQLVLCPDINDKEKLEGTLADLKTMDSVASVGIVPVGLSKYREGLTDIRRFDQGEVEELVDTVESEQSARTARGEEPWVYLADEFYTAYGLEIPAAGRYGDYPQLENGIGTSRQFMDGMERGMKLLKKGEISGRGEFTAVTGALAAPLIERVAEKVRSRGAKMTVVAAENRFLGGGVTVAGLVSGRDVERALKETGVSGRVIVPDVMLNGCGLFIDDKTPQEISRSCGVQVEVVPSDGAGFVEWLAGGGE